MSKVDRIMTTVSVKYQNNNHRYLNQKAILQGENQKYQENSILIMRSRNNCHKRLTRKSRFLNL